MTPEDRARVWIDTAGDYMDDPRGDGLTTAAALSAIASALIAIAEALADIRDTYKA